MQLILFPMREQSPPSPLKRAVDAYQGKFGNPEACVKWVLKKMGGHRHMLYADLLWRVGRHHPLDSTNLAERCRRSNGLVTLRLREMEREGWVQHELERSGRRGRPRKLWLKSI